MKLPLAKEFICTSNCFQSPCLDDEEAVIFGDLEGVGCGEDKRGLKPPEARRLGRRLVLGPAERAAAPRG